MKQRLFAFGDDFHIRDESGRDVFFVDGRALSLGDKLSFQDMNGRELVYIRQRRLTLTPMYELYRDDRLAAVVKRELFTFFRCRFHVDVSGPDDLEAEGDFLDMEYRFSRGGRRVAEVSKRWFSWGDTYGVEVAEGEDDVLILAATVVIDMICHDEERR